MVRVRISNPNTWYLQCDWIEKYCEDYECDTNWSAWNIGYDDIYYYVKPRDATVFYLMWGN